MTLTLIAVAPRSSPNADPTTVRVPEGLDLGPRWTDNERALEPYLPDGYFLCGYEQLHRERDHAFRTSWAHGLLYRLAWPSYDCQLCVGQDEWAVCYCSHHGCAGPGVGPEAWRLWARRLWSVVARRCGMYDPGRR